MKLRPFIGVVGTLHIVQLNANKNIGTENTKGCAEEKGDFPPNYVIIQTKFAFGTRNILEKINETSNYTTCCSPIYTQFYYVHFLVIIFRLLLNVCLAWWKLKLYTKTNHVAEDLKIKKVIWNELPKLSHGYSAKSFQIINTFFSNLPIWKSFWSTVWILWLWWKFQDNWC